MKKSTSGFTIVELLIVIVVIAILAAITIVAYNDIQDRAITSRSLSDLHSVEKALQIYHATNGSYPTSSNWRNSADNPTDYVPGLVPGTVSTLPTPPAATGVYMYRSDGADYKFMAHAGKYANLCQQVKAAHPEMVPNRDCWAYAVYSPGGVNF